jgi:short-subunit dehydrogenase
VTDNAKMNGIERLLQPWRRRRWRPDPERLAAFAALRPMTVVTGASEGIGFALARRFAKGGHDLLLVARRPAPLERAACRISAECGVLAVPLPLDVTSSGAIAAIEAALAGRGRYADVLINSAGIGLAGCFHEQAPEALLQLIAVNVRAVTLLSRHFLEGMRVRGRGGIVNLASLGAFAPGPYQAVYYASKAYVLSFSEAVAAEVTGEGVRITALAPGPVGTAFHARMRAEHAFYRLLLPSASAPWVARTGYLGFVLGWRVVVPGPASLVLALALRLGPHRILSPIIGWLLRPRNGPSTGLKDGATNEPGDAARIASANGSAIDPGTRPRRGKVGDAGG